MRSLENLEFKNFYPLEHPLNCKFIVLLLLTLLNIIEIIRNTKEFAMM